MRIRRKIENHMLSYNPRFLDALEWAVVDEDFLELEMNDA